MTLLAVNVSGRPVPESLRQLLHQPLSMQEDVLLCSAALSPLSEQLDPLANDLLLDLVLNRLVAQGRHLEALRLLNATAIKPATTEAARRRALLSKSIKNVLTEVDLSVLSLDVPNESSQSDSLSAGGHADVDMGQHPWASTEEPHPAPAAKSLAEAQRNANLRTQALKDTAVQEQKNAPLSASPTLRKPHTGMDGSSTLAHHPLEAFKLAAMSRSPSHFQLTRSPSVSRAASPAAASPHRSRASGSPFVHKPTLALRRESARASPSISRHIPQIADISTGSAGADQSIDTVTHSPIVHRTRSRGNKTRLNIKTPKKTVLEHSQKRSAPHPQEDAGPPKVQALDPESEAEAEAEDNDAPTASTPKGSAVRGRRKQARLQIEPTDMATMMRKRNQLPGHFDMDLGEQSDDDTLSRRTATDDEDEDEDDFAEPWSALTQSSSIRKPRHIRANAPEPPTPANPLPTPRRSARLSQSVSRETSVDSLASSTSSLPRQSLKKGNAKGRAKPPRAPRREESLVEEDEEMTA